MNTFEKIHITGFRRLSDVLVELKPLNVVIGANGSGKTSLLDVFSLLAASASGRLNETIERSWRHRCQPDEPPGGERGEGEVHGVRPGDGGTRVQSD